MAGVDSCWTGRVVCALLCVSPQDIQQRAANKEHMLGLVNAERKATNDRKRIERELFDSLRRDKVDSIQKMQVMISMQTLCLTTPNSIFCAHGVEWELVSAVSLLHSCTFGGHLLWAESKGELAHE
jgi:hypothetical protein